MTLCKELRQFAESGRVDAKSVDGFDVSIADLCNRAADAIEGKLTFTLTDTADDAEPPKSVECRITADVSGIYIRPKGYGDYCSVDGEGCPVLVEFFDGEMRVVAWPDINEEEAVHIISLEGAREDAREEDDDNDTPGI